jgi:holin-like protein
VKRKLAFFLRVSIQILFLYGLNEAGNLIVEVSHLPLPGNLIGMVLLFLLLTAKIIPLHWVKEGSSILLKHLSLFFIPIAVGLMSYGDLFLHQGWIFFLCILLSLWIGMYTTGGISQFLVRKKEQLPAKRETKIWIN